MIIELVIIVIVIFLGFKLPVLWNLKQKERKNLNWLWLFHIVFALVYFLYTSSDGGSDSLRYWETAKRMSYIEALSGLFAGRGTYFMFAINYPLANFLSLTYFTGTIIYSLLGFIGLALYYKIVLEIIPYNSIFFNIKLFPILFFLPNLHFWSAGIGKDTLLFLSISLFAYSIMKLKSRIVMLIISLAICLFVRPHIALFLLLAFAFAFLFNSKIMGYKRVLLFSVLLAGGMAVLPKVLEITKIDDLSIDSYSQFSATKSSQLSMAHTGSAVDISSYPYPLKIFTFLFRPTFIDLIGIPAIIAAFENLLLLILFIKVVAFKPRVVFNKAPFVLKGLVLFLIFGTLAFSLTLGNMGIMLRMRNMFLPGMLIYFLWAFSYRKQILLNSTPTYKNQKHN